mmetsp:Transcript_51088/g.121378  ORF Transcript_51088/g.121378 Transcript_51088/m.121378 type:complete len:599 (+) Transcript_51088:126-1922(+)
MLTVVQVLALLLAAASAILLVVPGLALIRFLLRPWMYAAPLQSLKKMLRISAIGGGDVSALQKRINDVAEERFIIRAHWMVHLLTVWLAPFVVLGWITFILTSLRDDGDEEGNFVQQFIPRLIMIPVHLMGVVCYLKPECVSRRKARVIFAVLMLRETSIVAFPTDDETYAEVALAYSTLGQMWVGLVLQESKFMTAMHVLLVPLWTMLAVVGNPLVDCGHITTSRRTDLLGVQVALGAIVCLTTASLEQGTYASIKAEIQAHSSQEMSSAAHNLLSGLCDAVVHLDSDLRIISGQQSLAALLCCSTSVSIIRESFCDVINDVKGAEAFKSFVHQKGNHPHFASTMHITLRDVNSLVFPVQLFLTQCSDSAGRTVHVVGIRDDSIDARLPTYVSATEEYPVEPSQPSTSAASPTKQPTRKSFGCLPSIGEQAMASDDSDSLMNLDTHASADDAKVWLDAVLTPEGAVRMLRWTPAFISIIGLNSMSAGSSNFLDLVVDKESFLSEFQPRTNDLFHDDELSSVPFAVIISSPIGKTLRLVGSIALDNPSTEAGEDGEDLPQVAFTLETWHHVQLSRRRDQAMARQCPPEPLSASDVISL